MRLFEVFIDDLLALSRLVDQYRGFRATGFADPDADGPAEGEGPASSDPALTSQDSPAFREISQSRPWDLRRARILFHEQQRREECTHGRSDSEEEL